MNQSLAGADSGLAVYKDIAEIKAYQDRNLEYMNICQPHWLDDDAGLFYGFWGQCLKDYRSAQPHEGYEIVQRWRDRVNAKSKARNTRHIRRRIQSRVDKQRPFDDDDVQHHMPYDIITTNDQTNEEAWAGAFFSFTSNVDAHFHDFLRTQELYECHGNVELWQCSDPYCFDPQPSMIWRMPLDFDFAIDKETMMAPPRKSDLKKKKEAEVSSQSDHLQLSAEGEPVPHIGQTRRTSQQSRSNLLQDMPPSRNTTKLSFRDHNDNYPKCPCCGNLARPAILMFGDLDYKRDYSQKIRWDLWRKSVYDLAHSCSEDKKDSKRRALRVCVLEAGAGIRIPTARRTSELFVTDLSREGLHAKATLVRINPDFPLANDLPEDCVIPIMDRGLRAVRKIEEYYSQRMKRTKEPSNASTTS